MRKAKGALLPPVSMKRPRRRDLYGAMRAAVLEGVLPSGERLPSSRCAAADYGVSRGVMEEVFAQLTEEGFLERTVGRGTFVAAAVSRLPQQRIETQRRQRLPSLSRRGRLLSANAACREPGVLRPFNAGIADTSEFPWNIWQRAEARAAKELGRRALMFADPRGLPSLRAAIARYLAQFRGIRCDPGQIVIFNSAQQAINAFSLLLLDRGDAVWLEDPCYPGARAAFELCGANIIPIPVDDEGLCLDMAVRNSSRPHLAYVTPSHQYPTGALLSLERRIALLEWASRNQSWVVEDDYDGEFRYEGQPLTPLYSLDSQQRVLYLGTLNKSMFVSLRLAYAVVPEPLVEPLANIRTQLDGFTPAERQMAMSLFMDEGHFSAHLRRMRAIYGARHAILIEGIAPLASQGWAWPTNRAGIHLLLRHKRASYVRAVAKTSSLELALLSSYSALPRRDDGLFLRFGALNIAALQEGIAALVKAARL